MRSAMKATLFALSAGAAMCGVSAYAAAPPRTLAATAVTEGTIAGLQRRIRAGELSCEQVVSAYLERIAAYDDATGLHAITAVARDALAQARATDERLRRGVSPPPLFCVAVAVKDNIDTAGLPTTGGSVVLKDSVPPDDAALIRALREAGAIVLAKTNMGEWAFSPRRTISSTAGATANAYAREYTPAGSSGGTASAVAASLALVGLGTDTGNSVRGPSSHLGLVGMRPTYGLVSLDGVIPLLLDYDAVGPMTRTVEDNARLLSVIAAGANGERAKHDYAAQLSTRPLRGARIGVVRELANAQAMDPQIAQLFARALSDLRAAGAVVVDDAAIADLQMHMEGGEYCPRFRADVNAYLRSLGERAPIADVLDVFLSGRYAPSSKQQFTFFVGDVAASVKTDCPPLEAHAGRQAFRASVVAAMDRAQLDALVYPTWTHPPALLARADEDYRGDNSQLIAPATGLPALTVPMGLAGVGLPAGLQLLGRPWAEAVLYSLAADYERKTHHRAPPTGYPPLADSTVRPDVVGSR